MMPLPQAQRSQGRDDCMYVRMYGTFGIRRGVRRSAAGRGSQGAQVRGRGAFRMPMAANAACPARHTRREGRTGLVLQRLTLTGLGKIRRRRKRLGSTVGHRSYDCLHPSDASGVRGRDVR